MQQVPYMVLNSKEIEPNYRCSRRYNLILRKMGLQLHSNRHQILFTDDTRRGGDIVTIYFLHVDSLTDGRLGRLERGIIGSSLSSPEVANSPQLYVDLEAGKSEESQSESSNGDGVNQKRFYPRVFNEVVRFDFGSPLYKEWAKEVWQQIGLQYARVDKDKRDIWLFTECDIAPRLLEYFEVQPNRVLFVNEVQSPQTEEEKQTLLKGLQRGLYREKRYGFDHRDYVQRIPNVVWVVPFDLCAEFEDQYNLSCGITPSEYPDTNVLLHTPFNKWLKGLPEKFKAVDEKRKREGALRTMSEYMMSRLESVLESVSKGLEKIRQEQNLEGQPLLNFLGLTLEELVYLEQFQRKTK